MRAFTISCWDEFPTSHPGIITSHQNVIIKAIHHAAKSDARFDHASHELEDLECLRYKRESES